MPDKAFEEQLRQFFQSTEDGEAERFKYKVIEGLSESIRQMVAQMTKVQETQVEMLVRLAKLEANKVGEEITELKGRIENIDSRIDALMRDKDRRDGATNLLQKIPGWVQFLVVVSSIFTAIYLAGRSAGIVPSPPMAPVRIETPAGGKP